MAYRNGTYVAFDGNGTTNPTKGDMKYYGLLQMWNKSNKYDLNFSDSHKKTYQVQDSSQLETLKKRLLQRMASSKNMLLIISDDTNWDRGLLNYEIEKAVDYYELPIIVAYTGVSNITSPVSLENKWPKALNERIKNRTAKCVHIPFNERMVSMAISQVNINNKPTSALSYYRG
ncbi:TIR domain-containing protein [Clostridium sp.]|uniref:TIR domain-containing protein n=1 Tax=Clostridium sp. TaxID=1506 RepID=UPI003995E302